MEGLREFISRQKHYKSTRQIFLWRGTKRVSILFKSLPEWVGNHVALERDLTKDHGLRRRIRSSFHTSMRMGRGSGGIYLNEQVRR
ncbi:hypothetical protein QJS10_CPB19g01869 [Acorus calamus]|uniref:Uncharacterized protein n=1 Tax=Acorus calamus TaxID=4465 RepID=A0AAV9CHL2_ACOCL|nr:hypothetical protein QJS10_CPB19g01869 [Acorus calamus]